MVKVLNKDLKLYKQEIFFLLTNTYFLNFNESLFFFKNQSILKFVNLYLE